MKNIFIITLLSLLLFSCNMNEKEELTTEIDGVGWVLFNNPIKDGDTTTESVVLSINGHITNEIQTEDITRIYIENIFTGIYWDFTGDYISDIYNESNNIFNCLIVDSTHTDLIPIGDYKVKIELINGYTSEYTRNVPAPGESTPSTYNYVGNEDYTGNISRAHMPKRADSITVSKDSDNLDVTFSVDDDIIFNGYVLFYNSAGYYIGNSGTFKDYTTSEISSFVNSGTVLYTDGQTNELVISLDDCYFESGYGLDDVAEICIILTDGEQYEGIDITYDAMSYSAYVDL